MKVGTSRITPDYPDKALLGRQISDVAIVRYGRMSFICRVAPLEDFLWTVIGSDNSSVCHFVPLYQFTLRRNGIIELRM